MMLEKKRIDQTGAVFLIAFSALLGLNQVLIKIVNTGISPFFQVGLRSACAMLLVLAYALLKHRRLSISDGTLLAGMVAGLFFSLEFMLLFLALDYTSVARSSVLFYTMPFWVTIGAHFLIDDERITRLKLAGLALAVIGVVFALSHNADPASVRSLLGDLLSIGAAAIWAATALLLRTTSLKKSSPEMQFLYQLFFSAVFLVGLSVYTGEMLREPTVLIWSIFSFQVIVIVSFGFLTWLWVLSVYPVADMAVYSFLAPVFGVFFGWLILDEHISINIWLALVFIAASIVLVNWPDMRVGREVDRVSSITKKEAKKS